MIHRSAISRAPPRPEVLAFLQAIKENPDDDGLRLMLADWLEERGDPRGMFVRAQVEAARLPEGDARRDEMEIEAQELESTHGRSWAGPFCGGGRRWEFRRGLFALTMDASRFLTPNAPKWAETEAWAWVEEVDLSYLRPEDLSKLADSPLLSGMPLLSLAYCRWEKAPPDEGCLALVASPYLAGLVRLTLNGPHLGKAFVVALQAAGKATHLSRLRVLNLRQAELGCEGAAALARSPTLGRLTHSDLWSNNLGDAGVTALARSTYLTGLQSLDLGENQIGPAGAASLARSRCVAGLATLALNHNELGAKGAKALASSPQLTRLQELQLDRNGIEDAGAVALAASEVLAGVTTLSLAINGIGDRGAEALAASPFVRNLTTLDLRNNRIGNAGMRAIISSPQLAALQRCYWEARYPDWLFDEETEQLLAERFPNPD